MFLKELVEEKRISPVCSNCLVASKSESRSKLPSVHVSRPWATCKLDSDDKVVKE